jgi:hypothetical protein
MNALLKEEQQLPVIGEELPRYVLTYRNAKGEVKTHKIGTPFDPVTNKGVKVGFVAYSFGKGIRSFRNDRIVSCQELTP